ncbi:MAG: MFS transporter [Clostridiales bacterium]|nr:MFS transporter [Clostridiales bacterium]
MFQVLRRVRLELFDRTGLSQGQVKTLYLMIYCAMGGFSFGAITGGVVFTGFIKRLGASDFLYGVLIALPMLANSFQSFASAALEKWRNRRLLFMVAGLTQRAVWLPIGLLPLIPGISGGARMATVAALVAMSAAAVPFMNVTLISIFSDVVPLRIRGRYFAVRYRMVTLVSLAFGLIAGRLIDVLPGFGGYALAFSIASVLGGADIVCFLFMDIPPMDSQGPRRGMFRMLREVLRDGNYMRLVAFGALWYFGVFLASPYFNVYMGSVLNLSYTFIMVSGLVVANIATFFFVTRWGAAYDRFGTHPVLVLNVLLGSLVPLIWIFVQPGMIWPIIAANVLSGAQWPAFEIGVQNLFMGLAPDRGRSMYTAVYFIGSQLLGAALGSAAGGWLLDNALPAVEALGISFAGGSLTKYHYVFVLSGLVRLIAAAVLPTVREAGSAPLREVTARLRERIARPLPRRRTTREDSNGQ